MQQELLDLTKKVECVLDLRKIPDVKAQVCFAVDHSGSMDSLYRNGTVQKTVDRLSAVAVKFDDNQELDVLVFDDGVREAAAATPAMFGSYVQKEILNKGWSMGGTEYAPFINKVVDNYFGANALQSIGSTLKSIFGFGKQEQATSSNISRSGYPIFVVIVTDGENSDQGATTNLLRAMQDKNVYWQFVGIGNTRFRYLEQIADELPNVGFFSIQNLEGTKDMELYKELINPEFAEWVKKFPKK